MLSIAVFGLARAGPDPAEAIIRAGGGQPTAAALAAVRHQLGLDQGIVQQYVHWVSGVVHGDFGVSYVSRQPVTETFLQRLPATLELAGAAFLLAVVISLGGGLLAASRPHGARDWLTWGLALLGASVPTYFLGLLLAFALGVKLHWLPVAGNEEPLSIVLPAITLALGISAADLRLFRASLLAASAEPFALVARAKGLSDARVLVRHAGKRAIGPMLPALGISFGFLLGGAVIVETVFAWPGVGTLATDSIINGDAPMVQAYVLTLGAIFLASTLVIDALHARVDPTAAAALSGAGE